MYGFTGSTNFENISNSLTTQNIGAIFAMVFILVGLAFKVSAVPFHMWTPDVYQGAPTSITNFFAVVPKAVGLAVIIRFMDLPFKKYSSRMADNNSFYFYSLYDSGKCSSNRSKKYKEAFSL